MKKFLVALNFFCTPLLMAQYNEHDMALIQKGISLEERSSQLFRSVQAQEALAQVSTLLENHRDACSLSQKPAPILHHALALLIKGSAAEMRAQNIAPLFSEVFVPENNAWYVRGPINGWVAFNPSIAGYNSRTAQVSGVYLDEVSHVPLTIEHKLVLLDAELNRITMDKDLTNALIAPAQTTETGAAVDQNPHENLPTLAKALALISAKVGGGFLILHLLEKQAGRGVLVTLAQIGASLAIVNGAWNLFGLHFKQEPTHS